MAYRLDSQNKIPVSSFGLSDWLAASVALAVGASVFLLIAFFALWAIGMPGPLLWMGSGNIPADILEVVLSAGPVILFGNFMGSFIVVGFFAAIRKVRGR
jgi:hypothetical protein